MEIGIHDRYAINLRPLKDSVGNSIDCSFNLCIHTGFLVHSNNKTGRIYLNCRDSIARDKKTMQTESFLSLFLSTNTLRTLRPFIDRIETYVRETAFKQNSY